MPMIKIMFVCHGNICRSTMAEFVMKELVRRAGAADRFLIASSATSREEIGHDTYIGTKEKLREQGIPFTRRQAVQLTRQDGETYDKILAMDQENLRNLRRIVDDRQMHKVFRLLSFAGEEADIADPWYTGDFDAAYADVERGCTALLKQLLAAGKERG